MGKGLVGKGGVVRDPELHQEVITDIKNWVQYDMKDASHTITSNGSFII